MTHVWCYNKEINLLQIFTSVWYKIGVRYENIKLRYVVFNLNMSWIFWHVRNYVLIVSISLIFRISFKKMIFLPVSYNSYHSTFYNDIFIYNFLSLLDQQVWNESWFKWSVYNIDIVDTCITICNIGNSWLLVAWKL